MGYTVVAKPNSVTPKEYFTDWFQRNNFRVVEIAVVAGIVYAAVQLKGSNVVEGQVIKFTNTSGYCNFAFIVTSENEGPSNFKCPLKVLKALSPTDNQRANHWRTRCLYQNDKARDVKKTPPKNPLRVIK